MRIIKAKSSDLVLFYFAKRKSVIWHYEPPTLFHDWILYDSNLTIDQHKKDVLHDVKTLATQVRKLKDKPPKTAKGSSEANKRRKLFKKLLRK